MNARGITATSGRQFRSCEGAMVSHQAITPITSANTTAGMRRRRDSQSPQIANAANPAANPNRSSGKGRLEK
jgi:hypothetical protein